MIALILELIIATWIASAIWNAGHPIIAVLAWIGIMGLSNAAFPMGPPPPWETPPDPYDR